MAERRTGRSARWGAACAPCAAAKARCVGRQSPARCDRCVSLGEDCSDQVHRPRKKRRPVPAREGSIIISAYPSSSASTDSPTPNIPSREDIDHSSSSSPTCSCAASVRREDAFPIDSDETLLSIYTNQLFPQFPFVVIADGTTPKKMWETRPSLMKAIRMVASVRHLRSMRGQSAAVIQHISHAMFARSKRSLDLLQGILVTLGYYHYFCMSHAHFNNLLHLALSLVGDMDLSTCPVARKSGNQLPLMRTAEPKARTNEERRTLAGVWYMGSNAAFNANLLGPVRYTAYLDQTLKEIECAAEYETDQLVVQLVRIQHLTDRIFHFHARDQLVYELQEIPKAPTAACLETFQMQLDELRNTLSSNLKHHYVLSCHYNSAYLCLFASPLAQAHLDPLPHADLSIPDVFARFTAALRAWFADWLAVPVCMYFYIPQPVSAQLIHAAMMLTRWAKIAGPGALKLAGTSATAPPWKEAAATPAFSGVRPCPDLSVPQLPATEPCASSVLTQTLNALRTRVLAEPSLWLDVFGILDTMTVRFEAAKKEMTIAHGRVWENDTWDLAAEQIKIKKSKIEKWCVVTAALGKGRTRVADAANVSETNGETINTVSAERGIEGLEWPMSGDGQESMQWESELFDGIMMDIDLGVILDTYSSWDTDGLDQMGSAGGPNVGGHQDA